MTDPIIPSPAFVPPITGEPAIDFFLQYAPDFLHMLPTVDAQVAAVAIEAFEGIVVAARAIAKARGITPPIAKSTIDAASEAALDARFPKS